MTEIPANILIAKPATPAQASTHSRLLHWSSLATLVVTFPLIFMGGLVTSHDAGMSVPDWPNSFGYNMFLLPFNYWWNDSGVFYEHSHRLLGTLVGFLAIIQVLVAWRVEPRAWARWLHTGVLAFVIIQGVLGGLRVLWVDLDLAIVHACTGQAFFTYAGAVALISSRWWSEAKPQTMQRGLGRIGVVASIAVGLIGAQLVVGALMRHYDAGMAIPDLPLAYGKILPPISAAELDEINQYRAWHMPELTRDVTVTMTQVWLHYLHRVGAIVVSLALIVLLVLAFRSWTGVLVRSGLIVAVLLVGQFTLGLLVVYFNKPADIASYHVAVGALLMLFTFTLCLRAFRMNHLAHASASVNSRSTPSEAA